MNLLIKKFVFDTDCLYTITIVDFDSKKKFGLFILRKSVVILYFKIDFKSI